MHSDVHLIRPGECKRVAMKRGRPTRFGTGDIEANHALVKVAHPNSKPGDLQRPLLGSHRTDDRVHDNGSSDGCSFRHTGPESFLHRLHDGIEGEALMHVQLGSEAHLGVHDAIGRKVECGLTGDPHEVIGALHYGAGVLEGGEVLQQVLRLGTAHEPPVQLARVGRRQTRRPPDLVGQLHNGGGTEPAVEVVVKNDLRHLNRLGGIEKGAHRRGVLSSAETRPTEACAAQGRRTPPHRVRGRQSSYPRYGCAKGRRAMV